MYTCADVRIHTYYTLGNLCISAYLVFDEKKTPITVHKQDMFDGHYLDFSVVHVDPPSWFEKYILRRTWYDKVKLESKKLQRKAVESLNLRNKEKQEQERLEKEALRIVGSEQLEEVLFHKGRYLLNYYSSISWGPTTGWKDRTSKCTDDAIYCDGDTKVQVGS